jgi:hypothetical protein
MARRITPTAVDQPAASAGGLLGAEAPLDVGPAPDQGDVRAVHPSLGAGRRVWVDIQNTTELRFKQVCHAAYEGSKITNFSPSFLGFAPDTPRGAWLCSGLETGTYDMHAVLCCLAAGAEAAGLGLQLMEARTGAAV